MPSKATRRPSKILSKKNLFEAWEKARTQGKRFKLAGSDGVSGADFRSNLHQNIAKIAKLVASGQYQFRPLEICWLPKRDNPTKERLICVPTVADRLVQRTISSYLEDGDKLKISNPVSFGFQQFKSVNDAVMQALIYRNDNMGWVVKTDICAFFDRVPREQLANDLKGKIPDSLYPLVVQIIACEANIKTKLDASKMQSKGIVKGVGLRQGMPLSPMLSNFALRKFDDKATKSGLKMVRYADDIACFCQTKCEAEETLKTIKNWLEDLGYNIPDLVEQTKTKIVAPNDAVEFLGYDIKFESSVQHYEVAISNLVYERVKQSFKKLASLSTCQEEGWKFADVVKSLNSKSIAYTNSYKLANNIEDLNRKMKDWHRDALRSLLNELFGEKVVARLTQEKLHFLGLVVSL